MITALNIIKNWFKTGLYPTQTQFWAVFDSFWHKDESIPQNKIINLEGALDQKAERAQFLTHITGTNAHTIQNITDLQDALNSKAAISHTHTFDQIAGLNDKLSTLSGEIQDRQLLSQKNQANGYVGLNSLGKIDPSMYEVASSPAPFFLDIIPDSYLPNNRGNFRIRGAFFTQEMIVTFQNQTVHGITFISSIEIIVNASIGSAEGNFDITLNNGKTTVAPGRLLVVEGEVFTPDNDWTAVSGDIDYFTAGEVKTTATLTPGSATWVKAIDHTKRFSIYWKPQKSGFNPTPAESLNDHLLLTDTVTGNTWKFRFHFIPSNQSEIRFEKNGSFVSNLAYDAGPMQNTYRLYYDGTGLKIDRNYLGFAAVESIILPNNLSLSFQVGNFDVTGIKYVEHP